MSDKKLFAKNSLSGVFQKIIIALLTFFTIPIFIAKLGVESYGIFATVSVIGDLSRIANIGFHIALIKYLSQQGKTKESSFDIIVGFTSMMVIIVPISLFMIFFNEFVLLNILNISMEYLERSKVLFNYLVLSNMLLFLGLTFSAMLEALKLIYKDNILQLVYSIAYWSLILVVLSLGYDIEAVGLMAFLAALLWFILIFYMALRAWGKLSYRGITKFYFKSVRKQLMYGLKIYASGLMGLFGEPMIKVLVANFFGNTFVGFLDIGIRIRNQITRIFQAALWPLFQLFSEMRDNAQKARIVREVGEKVTLVLIPISMMLIFGARPLVTLWIGNNVEIIALNVMVVAVSSLVGSLIIQANNNYFGVDHPLTLLFNSTVFNVLSLGIIYFFNKQMGYNSVFLSFIISNLALLFLGLFFQKKYLGTAIFDSSKILPVKLFSVIGIMLGIGLLLTFIHLNPVASLIVTGAVFSVVPLILYIVFGLLTKDDLDRYIKGKQIAMPIHNMIERRNRIIMLFQNKFNNIKQ